MPTKHQGVALRSIGDPVLYLSNPPGVTDSRRRKMLDGLGELNQKKLAEVGDPEINARIAQYEMAYRMQTSVPELTDLSGEPESIDKLYGDAVRKPGTFALFGGNSKEAVSMSETLDLKPEIEAKKVPDLRESFKKGISLISMLLLLVATFQLYFSIGRIIDTWFEYQYAMIFEAAYYLFVLLVSLYIIRLYIIKR